MITRRQMLARMLGGSVALAAADIWIPGERTISLPPKAILYGDQLVTYAPALPAELSYLDRLVGMRERALQIIRHPTTGQPQTIWCEDRYIT